VTSTEFENKWLRDPGGILAGDPRRFEVARVAYAVRQRMTQDGMSAERAVERVLEEPYYRDALTVIVNPLNGDGDDDVIRDFRSIDAP
jgi:hypothetical protein